MNNNKILFINLGNYGSTGKIIDGISSSSKTFGFVCYKAYRATSNNKPKGNNELIIGTTFFNKVYEKMAYYSGLSGSFARLQTQSLINKIKKIQPSIIHLHNIHSEYINFKLLFKFLERTNIPVVWTFHDCWPFTGRCPHFQISGCYEWLRNCDNCLYPKNDYPQSRINRSSNLLKKKKVLFGSLPNLHIVTPSIWLCNLVKRSFFKKYDIRVINNGIDLNVFHPALSDFRKKHNLEKKHLVLGVASSWDYKKGFDVFLKLSGVLPSDYSIVLVGTDDSMNEMIPNNILSIQKTHNQKELAEIYSSCDVFVNPTREDTFPTVNIEALACGCPVITYNSGGSPEILDKNSGIVLDDRGIGELIFSIKKVCEFNAIKKEDCISRAQTFDMNKKFKEYTLLYNDILLTKEDDKLNE